MIRLLFGEGKLCGKLAMRKIRLHNCAFLNVDHTQRKTREITAVDTPQTGFMRSFSALPIISLTFNLICTKNEIRRHVEAGACGLE